MKRRFLQVLVIAPLLVGSGAIQTMAEETGSATTAQAAIFLPFDFYPRHQEKLGLNKEQLREMQRIASSVRETAQKFEDERGKRIKALQEMMAQTPVDVDKAMELFEAVLKAENELKALQFRSGLLMRNTLRPEQLKNVQALAAKEGASRGADARLKLNDRLQQLRAEIHKRSGNEPPPEVIEQVKKIEQAVMDGRFAEAKNQLEHLLRHLRGEPQ